MQDVHIPNRPSNSRPDRRKRLEDRLPKVSDVNLRMMHIADLIYLGQFIAETIPEIADEDKRKRKITYSLEGLFVALAALNSSALSDLLDVENSLRTRGDA